jgi:hypothetical protein
VVDIRFGLLKKLSRDFFRELGATVPDRELIPLALEFMRIKSEGQYLMTSKVKSILEKHPRFPKVLDDLRRDEVLTYEDLVKIQAGNQGKRRT